MISADRITLEILTSNDEPDGLGDFIENSPNGTLFHRPRFLSYHPADKFPASNYQTAHAVFRKGSKILAFIPGAHVKLSDGSWEYRSPVGSSCGGFVSGIMQYKEAEQCLGLFLEEIRRKSSKISITPPAECYERSPSGNTWRFLLLAQGFSVSSGVLGHVKNLDDAAPYEDDFTHSGRKNLNKARRSGLKVSVASERLDDFYSILLATKIRLGARPTHTLAELCALQELFPGRQILFTAGKDSALAAAAYCLKTTPHCLTVFYYCDDPSFRDIRPTNLLLHEILTWAKAQGYRYVDFGPSTAGYSANPGVISFKESFNCSPFLRLTYAKSVVLH